MDEQPIRIVHIIGKWLGGGVESVVMNYYRNIDRKKIQFDFICDDDSSNIPYNEIEKLGGKVILVPPYQKIFKYLKELKKVLKNGNYKIIHSHINTLSIFPLFIAKVVKIPVRIAHSHSTTNKKEKRKNFIKQILRPFSKLFATDYFACSEYSGRWLFGNKEFENGNIYILNNAIEIEKFKFNKDVRIEMRKNLNINDDTLVIGNIGRFVEQKNHTFLIDVFNEVKKQKSNSVLLLIGQGPLENKIKNKVKELELGDSVKFLGQRNDVDRLYQAMDIFLLPSLYEGLGMVLIEAQANSLFSICSNNVPIEAKITENILFLKLEKEIWKSNILNFKNVNRNNKTKNNLKNNKYEILEQSKMLEEKYLNLIGLKK